MSDLTRAYDQAAIDDAKTLLVEAQRAWEAGDDEAGELIAQALAALRRA